MTNKNVKTLVVLCNKPTTVLVKILISRTVNRQFTSTKLVTTFVFTYIALVTRLLAILFYTFNIN